MSGHVSIKALRELFPDTPIHVLWFKREVKGGKSGQRPHEAWVVEPGCDDVAVAQIDAASRQQWNQYFTVGELDPRYLQNVKANPTKPNVIKPTKKVVARVSVHQIDIDPPDSLAPDDYPGWRRDTLAKLRAAVSDGKLPLWRLAINSGSGLQIFWKRAEAFEVNGDLALASQAEQVTLGIMEVVRSLGLQTPDKCQNVERLMRVPGPTNFPYDQKKIDKGRKPSPTSVEDRNPTAVLTPEECERLSQVAAHPEIGAPRPGLTGSLRDLERQSPWAMDHPIFQPVEELPALSGDINTDLEGYPVGDWAKRVIVNGFDGLTEKEQVDYHAKRDEEGGSRDSRNELWMGVYAALVTAYVPAPLAQAVLFDRYHASAEYHRDRKKTWAALISHDLPRAIIGAINAGTLTPETIREETAEEIGDSDRPPTAHPGAMLRWMRRRHAAILNSEDGVKMMTRTRVFTGLADPRDPTSAMFRNQLLFRSPQAFRDAHHSTFVPTGMTDKSGAPIKERLGKWYWDHPDRQEYDRVTFAPGLPSRIGNEFNLYTGLGVEPDADADWSRLLWHYKHLIFVNPDGSPNEEFLDYGLSWMAHTIQFPYGPIGVIQAWIGDKGIGKTHGQLAWLRLHGNHGLMIARGDLLHGKFNGHLWDVSALVANEAVAPGDTEGENTLRSLCTEDEIIIEKKGATPVPIKNHLKIMANSNNPKVFNASARERRAAVFDCIDPAVAADRGYRLTREDYYAPLLAEIGGGGLKGFLAHLLDRDLSRFDPGIIPETRALVRQKMLSLAPVEEWWHLQLLEGALGGYKPQGWDPLSRPSYWGQRGEAGLLATIRRFSKRCAAMSDREIRLALNDLPGEPFEATKTQFGGGSQRGVRVVKALSVCRAAFFARFGPQDWSDRDAQWPTEAKGTETNAEELNHVPF